MMLYHFHGHPKKLYYRGELMAELRKRSERRK
jgi:hypothetical protein